MYVPKYHLNKEDAIHTFIYIYLQTLCYTCIGVCTQRKFNFGVIDSNHGYSNTIIQYSYYWIIFINILFRTRKKHLYGMCNIFIINTVMIEDGGILKCLDIL